LFEELENDANGKDPKTVSMYVNAIHEFEVANNFKDFRKYNSDWAIIFKDYMNDKRNKNTGQNISKSYYYHYMGFVRQFLEWLRENEKDYAKINKRDIRYLNTTKNDKNQAKATNYPESHNIPDILATILKMPENTEIEKRNKAMLSLFVLTTPRISSMQEARVGKIRYFEDYDIWAFMQDPRLQNTKTSQCITAFFIGQVEDLIANVINWKKHLESQGRKDKDYLFPKITPSFTKEGNTEMILTKEYIQSPTQIRQLVREAYENNGLKYIKPHNFRHSITRHVRKTSTNPVNTTIALAENYGQNNGFSVMVGRYGGDSLGERAAFMKAIVLE
jgi:integrase